MLDTGPARLRMRGPVYRCTSEDFAYVGTRLVRAENQDRGLFDGQDEHEINLHPNNRSDRMFHKHLTISPSPGRTVTDLK